MPRDLFVRICNADIHLVCSFVRSGYRTAPRGPSLVGLLYYGRLRLRAAVLRSATPASRGGQPLSTHVRTSPPVSSTLEYPLPFRPTYLLSRRCRYAR